MTTSMTDSPRATRPSVGTPIADYALLSDCNSAALVSRDGAVEWLCMPRFDSPSIFARILDADAGHWTIQPTAEFTTERRYLPGSLVVETTFRTATGVARLTDALAFSDGQRGHDLGLNAPHELIRLAEGIEGQVELRMELAPRPEYGLVRPLFRRTQTGGQTFGANRIFVRTDLDVTIVDATMTATFVARAGAPIGISLGFATVEQAVATPTEPSDVPTRIGKIAAAWQSWEHEHSIYEGPHKDLVQFSARVLKGLTYRPSGAMVAAPTTSLPETVGGERNWDYRFAWVRDASFTVEALYIGACSDEAEDFISFMTSSAGGRVLGDTPLQIMFGIGGEHDLTERTLPHLRGWRDSAPVRVGNGAWTQEQLDVYGELLNCLHLSQSKVGDLHPEIQQFVADLADAAARRWTERDAGMWEMRGDTQHHLSSKVLCWVALDRAVSLAPKLGAFAKVDAWSTERDAIREAILTRGWSESRQAYAQAFESDELDAAALLMPMYGFLPATDPRMCATIEAIARDLTEGGLVLRYRNDVGLNADGLLGEEGTFVICSFWLVSCLAMAGEIDRAETLFAQLTGYANDLGLLGEEIETNVGEQLGNFPQAFSHIGLIRAAADIDRVRGVRS